MIHTIPSYTIQNCEEELKSRERITRKLSLNSDYMTNRIYYQYLILSLRGLKKTRS